MHYRSSFNKFFMGLCMSGALAVSLPLNAAQLDFWAEDGWSVMDAEDSAASTDYVGPGWGAQAVKQLEADVTAEKSVIIGFRIADIYPETFTYEKGERQGQTGVSIKGRLLRVKFAKVNGESIALPQSASATVNCRVMPDVAAGEFELTLRAVVNDPTITGTTT